MKDDLDSLPRSSSIFLNRSFLITTETCLPISLGRATKYMRVHTTNNVIKEFEIAKNMADVTLPNAVAALRDYNRVLVTSSSDPLALQNWIARHVELGVDKIDKDCAIAILSYMNHPLYVSSSLTNEQQSWAVLIPSAEQILLEEQAWSNNQTSLNNQTMFSRIFSSDLNWIKDYTQMDVGMEFLINRVIDELRTCQGATGAGGIPHTVYNPTASSSQVP